MDAMSTESYVRPRYGNWLRPRTAGLKKLNRAGTLTFLVGAGVTVITQMISGSIVVAAVPALLTFGATMGMVWERDGLNLGQRLVRRIAWRRTRRAGAHLYRSGPLGSTFMGRFQPPGILAAATLEEHHDAFGRTFALVSYPQTRHAALVFTSRPNGNTGWDAGDVDQLVANFGGYLSGLGDEPGVVGAQVTIETSYDTGQAFQARILEQISPDAPPLAARILRETAADTRGAPVINAWATVTFERGSNTTVEEFHRELATRVPHLAARASNTGAGEVRPASAREIAEMVRVAYDPAAARMFEEANARGDQLEVPWQDAGPSATQATWEDYRHDSGHSVTWSWVRPPRGQVFSDLLASLLVPTNVAARRRVTLVYEPMDSADAVEIAENDMTEAETRAVDATRGVSAKLNFKLAEKTASEVATGAGLVDFSMLVTVTVTKGQDLAAAAAATMAATKRSKIRMRPVYGSQDSAFAAALPLGLVLPDHVMLPAAIRKAVAA